jgi:hypothetical protein
MIDNRIPPASSERRLVVLLDLNGTLAYRSSFAVTGSVIRGEQSKGRWIYPRPGAAKLIERLAAECRVFICTSMIEANAVAVLKTIRTDYGSFVERLLDRSFNKADPDRSEGGNEWDTIRDVPKILTAVKPAGLSSLIFVDNELRKCRGAPSNCYILQEMSSEELQTNNTKILDAVGDALLAIAWAVRQGSSVPDAIGAATLMDGAVRARRLPEAQRVSPTDSITDLVARLGLGDGAVQPRTLDGTPPSTAAMRLTLALGSDDPEKGRAILSRSTLNLEHVEGSQLRLADLSNALVATVDLPLPAGVRIERSIALSRLLTLSVAWRVLVTRGDRETLVDSTAPAT